MNQLTLFLLQLAFLGLLWAFIFAIVYALRTDLFGPPQTRMDNRAASPDLSKSGKPEKGARQETIFDKKPRTLVVVSGPEQGVSLKLSSANQISIGRSKDSDLVLREDDISNHHARLILWDDQWVIQDLDSTNGTFIDGNRVSVPTPVGVESSISLGSTTFELQS